MSEREYAQGAGPSDGKRCQFCMDGIVYKSLVYVSGPDPFRGMPVTVTRSGQCRHCRGTGVYDPAQDPTLEHWRYKPPGGGLD